ncbi:MAG: hypothetical protein P1U56_22205 [Saprospiraceae bacterium]|nr:hypothetical protein [Saprospiraceae bacterium]
MANTLIVESGSTKTDWVILTPKGQHRFNTKGINPSANSEMYLLEIECPELLEYATIIDSIYYYGAGVIDDRTRTIIHNWLKPYFSSCKEFQIESDTLGSAIATAGDKPGIVCILGTGSNSCLYDGKSITDNIPALGYILSNEGGGSKIGSELIKAYFYRSLPEDVSTEFYTQYPLSKSEVVNALYNDGNPTAYLANFATFLNTTENKTWRKNFLFPLFQEFIDVRIKQYSDYLAYDIHFVGSIAYFYADILREVLQYNSLQCSSIVQKPIEGLVDYYK